MIEVRLAAPRRAAQLTALVLGAALLRALLLPLGDVLSTAVFAACLLGISLIQTPARLTEDVLWGRGAAILAGLAVGAVLLLPGISGSPTSRPLAAFWSWAAIAAIVATLEETAIRAVLYRSWRDEAGPVAAIVAGAAVFALIHLPRYGFAAMPLDLAVGFALSGLRAVTGRVLPCAVAHTIADWGAWFWA
ncbi:MAG TPA: CPBP family intramembrane glutamic endopeptidase [Candidatus Dormibacteraeota bacterium]|nr:CPBP family intramembrane glutamic endopeptidase [Candidatus Dormibacteraeota bacterium]